MLNVVSLALTFDVSLTVEEEVEEFYQDTIHIDRPQIPVYSVSLFVRQVVNTTFKLSGYLQMYFHRSA